MSYASFVMSHPYTVQQTKIWRQPGLSFGEARGNDEGKLLSWSLEKEAMKHLKLHASWLLFPKTMTTIPLLELLSSLLSWTMLSPNVIKYSCSYFTVFKMGRDWDSAKSFKFWAHCFSLVGAQCCPHQAQGQLIHICIRHPFLSLRCCEQ